MIYIFTEVLKEYYYGCCIVQASSKEEAIDHATSSYIDEVKEEFEKSACIEVPSLSTETKVIYSLSGGS